MFRSKSEHSIDDSSHFEDETSEHVLNSGDAIPGWTRGMAYGYCDGTLVLIAHISLRGLEGEEYKFCATCYRGSEVVERGHATHQGGREFKLPGGSMLESYIERPMLVGIGEFIEKPEKGRFFWVRSIVRLRALDPCLGLFTETGDPLLPLHLKSSPAVGNRKLEPVEIRRRVKSAVPHGQGIDKGVEGRPQIMDTIARDKGPPIQRRSLGDLDGKAIAGTFSVIISGDGIRFTPTPLSHFGIESVEVFLGAAKLQDATGEFRSDHAIRR
jgi:hypothetical protein